MGTTCLVKEITNALHISALSSSLLIAKPTTVSLNERYLVFTPAPIVSKVGTIKVGTVPKHISEIPPLVCERHPSPFMLILTRYNGQHL